MPRDSVAPTLIDDDEEITDEEAEAAIKATKDDPEWRAELQRRLDRVRTGPDESISLQEWRAGIEARFGIRLG